MDKADVEDLEFEIALHNVLYEEHNLPIISDREYDQLNTEYFNICETHAIEPAPELNADSGMMNPGPLTDTVYGMGFDRAKTEASYFMRIRQEEQEEIL